MISAKSLGAMPEFIRAEIGTVALETVMKRVGMPQAVLDNRDHYIPEAMLAQFLEQSALISGEAELGLLISPHLSVRDYDIWGEYVLAAPTLEESLNRAIRAISLHSADKVELNYHENGLASFSYDFQSRQVDGYRHISPCAVGAVLSIFRHYLGPHWRPICVYLDVQDLGNADRFEENFGCPVQFGRRLPAIIFNGVELDSQNGSKMRPTVTLNDVRRARFGGVPASAKGSTWELIMLQMLDGKPSLEDAARLMQVGVRRLQRSLSQEGVTFRELANLATVQRASELLSDSYMSVTEISMHLGYSSAAHFARAFRSQTGLSPTAYRDRSRHS